MTLASPSRMTRRCRRDEVCAVAIDVEGGQRDGENGRSGHQLHRSCWLERWSERTATMDGTAPMRSSASTAATAGNPNGTGLPTWLRHESSIGNPVMTLDVKSGASPDCMRARCEALERATAARP